MKKVFLPVVLIAVLVMFSPACKKEQELPQMTNSLVLSGLDVTQIITPGEFSLYYYVNLRKMVDSGMLDDIYGILKIFAEEGMEELDVNYDAAITQALKPAGLNHRKDFHEVFFGLSIKQKKMIPDIFFIFSGNFKDKKEQIMSFLAKEGGAEFTKTDFRGREIYSSAQGDFFIGWQSGDVCVVAPSMTTVKKIIKVYDGERLIEPTPEMITAAKAMKTDGLISGLYSFGAIMRQMETTPGMSMYKWMSDIEAMIINADIENRVLSSEVILYTNEDANLQNIANMTKGYMDMSVAMYYSNSPEMQKSVKNVKIDINEDERSINISSSVNMDKFMEAISGIIRGYIQMMGGLENMSKGYNK